MFSAKEYLGMGVAALDCILIGCAIKVIHGMTIECGLSIKKVV
jgi:hypothetical protein